MEEKAKTVAVIIAGDTRGRVARALAECAAHGFEVVVLGDEPEPIEMEPRMSPPILIEHRHRIKATPVYAKLERNRTHPRSPRESLRRKP